MRQLNFVRQQGLRDATPATCAYQYPALMWQPRTVLGLALIGALASSWPLFLVVGVVLWWSAMLPHLNPFDLTYNVVVAGPSGLPKLGPAPAPRRFAQFVDGGLALAIAFGLRTGAIVAARLLEAVMLATLVALVFGGFCVGSYLFLILSGQGRFAHRTLPWSRSE